MKRRLARFSALIGASVLVLVGGCGGGSSSSPSTSASVTIQSGSANIAQGTNVTLSWSSANTSSCTAGGAWIGSKAISGTQTVGPVYTSSTYTLTCSGSGGSAAGSASVTVSVGSGQLPFRREVVANGLAAWAKSFGDLDGDNLSDVVVGGGSVLGGKIVWYRQPNWQPYLLSATGGGDSLIVTDVDGDGFRDVISSNGLAWFRNPRGAGGDPTQIWTQSTVDASMIAHDLAIGDLDGDGRIDIVARPENTGSITVYLQRTAGVFTKIAIPTGTAPSGLGLAVADIDRDGRLDIVGGGYWLRTPVNPLVDPWTRYVIGTWSTGAAVQVADIDGDGRTDVVLSPSLAGAGFVAWFRAPVDPITQAWTRNNIVAAEDVHAFHVFDVNRDNKLDIVFAEMHTSSLHRIGVMYNDGAGASWTQQTIASDGSHNISVADINGDNAIDIVGSNSEVSANDGGALNIWFGVP